MTTIVKELTSQDGKMKIEIFRRESGTFGFGEWRYSEDPLERCWIQFGRDSECIAPDAQTAEREARARVDWLRENPLRVVFLDIDGVLNSERYVRERPPVAENELWTVDDLDPNGIRALNLVVRQTGAKFVLSSSWRHHHTLEEVAALFRERGFIGELIDVTPRLFGETRGTEIRTWLRVQATIPSAFAVLDDDAPTSDLDPSWVRTDTENGLTAADVERLVALLSSA